MGDNLFDWAEGTAPSHLDVHSMIACMRCWPESKRGTPYNLLLSFVQDHIFITILLGSCWLGGYWELFDLYPVEVQKCELRVA